MAAKDAMVFGSELIDLISSSDEEIIDDDDDGLSKVIREHFAELVAPCWRTTGVPVWWPHDGRQPERISALT